MSGIGQRSILPSMSDAKQARIPKFAPLSLVQRPAIINLLIVGGAALTHFWKLGQRPLAHDEAIDAWFSWQAGQGATVRYDPTYHGPLRFFLEGGLLRLLGTSPTATRSLSALCGVAMVIAVLSNSRLLGRSGAITSAILLSISPTFLTITRTGREDSLVALLSLGMLLAVGHLLTAPKTGHLIAFASLLALSFATKETTFIFCAAGVTFLAAVIVRNIFQATRRKANSSEFALMRIKNLGATAWLLSATAFIFLFSAVFTSFFRWNAGLKAGLYDGIAYWLSQHDVRRGSQPWFFYTAIYTSYEWLLIGLAAAGIAYTIRKRSIFGAWLSVMGIVQLAVYSWAGEKFAWLAVHPLVPFCLLAGFAVEVGLKPQRLGGHRIATGFGAAALGTLGLAVGPAITRGADPRELLVTVQTSESVPREANHLLAAAKNNPNLKVLVDDSDGGSWPWVWYLRDIQQVTYTKVDPNNLPTDFDAIILRGGRDSPKTPAGFEIRRFPLRVWWLPDYKHMGINEAARWLFNRTTWNPTGSFDQYLILRSAPQRRNVAPFPGSHQALGVYPKNRN
jgi:uncharacterized protein (TIGR03663 family)